MNHDSTSPEPDEENRESEQNIRFNIENNQGDIQAVNAGNDAYVAGRDLIIHQRTFQRPINEQTLLSEVQSEVTVRLRYSLYHSVLINLRKRESSRFIKRPWSAEVKVDLHPDENISDNSSILEIFDRDYISGKLVILGLPGTGKTTALLELAKDLVNRAIHQASQPIPILLNLSSWEKRKKSIVDWLKLELRNKYGVSLNLSKRFIKNQRFIYLLDGLDELKPINQEECVQAINEFLNGEDRPQKIVVCSRLEEYCNFKTKLNLRSAINLQKLTKDQIQKYVADVGHSQLLISINRNKNLLEICRTPLFLNITILTYKNIPTDKWGEFRSTSHLMSYLLEAYILQMLFKESSSKVHEPIQSSEDPTFRTWLTWLARYLKVNSEIDLLIENLQPDQLLTQQGKRIYKAAVLIFILCLVSFPILIFKGLISSKVATIFNLTILFIAKEPSNKITPVETFNLSWDDIQDSFTVGAMAGVSLGAVCG